MSMISVLIPVYKESKLLETLLNQLLKDEYKDKEIITVIDEPTKTSMNLAKKYKKQVKFILNKVRKGKVTALNEATKIAKGDIFLFFDSDVIISKKSRNFLKTVAEKTYVTKNSNKFLIKIVYKLKIKTNGVKKVKFNDKEIRDRKKSFPMKVSTKNKLNSDKSVGHHR